MATQTEQNPTEGIGQDWSDAIEQSNALEGEATSEEVVADEETAEQETPETVTAPARVALQTPVAQAEPIPMAAEVRLQEENTRLLREAQERQRETDEAYIQQTAAGYAEQLMNQYIQQGWDEAQAKQVAVAEVRSYLAEDRANRATMGAIRAELSQSHGVPQEELVGFKDEASMRHFAQQYQATVGPQAKELVEMKKEMGVMKKALAAQNAPVQNYNQTSGARGSSSAQEIFDKFGRGELEYTPEVQRAERALGYR